LVGGCCDKIYEMFDLKNYTILYSISSANVQEIKIKLVIKCDFKGQRWTHVSHEGDECLVQFGNIVSIIPFSSSLVHEIPIWILKVNDPHGKCILDDKLTTVLNMDSIKCSIKF